MVERALCRAKYIFLTTATLLHYIIKNRCLNKKDFLSISIATQYFSTLCARGNTGNPNNTHVRTVPVLILLTVQKQ
jgi:hypothetical protein